MQLRGRKGACQLCCAGICSQWAAASAPGISPADAAVKPALPYRLLYSQLLEAAAGSSAGGTADTQQAGELLRQFAARHSRALFMGACVMTSTVRQRRTETCFPKFDRGP